VYCNITVRGGEYWLYYFGIGGDRGGVRIAGSCPAVRGIIPVSTASGWTAVMFEE
jgi:hypothetical protein